MRAMDMANRAFEDVFDNLGVALRISGPIILLGIVITGLASATTLAALYGGDEVAAQAAVQKNFALILVAMILSYVVGLYWITVSWHRFILLDIRPGRIFPVFVAGPIWG